VKPLKHKSQVSAELKVILLAWEREKDLKVKKVCSDRGTEYNEFDASCASQGIKRDKSVAIYLPWPLERKSHPHMGIGRPPFKEPLRRGYTEDDMERFQPSQGRVLEVLRVTWKFS
jgi:hypothetical protein